MVASELVPGSVFAGHLIERRLGSGGMGTVYLAKHPTLPMRVALKVVGADRADTEYAALFRREARLAAGLDHPNIVDVKDFGEEDGRLWMSMRYVPGGDLAALIRAHRSGVEFGRAVHIVAEAAKALDYAHEHHVVHRDVKPANIFVTPGDAGADRVLVGDFGIARRTDPAATQTDTGVRAFTESYAPPEQRTGGRVDRRADVYALGITCYELLTGRLPAAMIADPLPEGVGAVLAKATRDVPDERYESCGELAAALAGATRAEPKRGFGTRRRVAAFGGVAAALVGAAVFLSVRADSGSRALPEPTGTTGLSPRCYFTTEAPSGDGYHVVLPTTNDGGRRCILSYVDSHPGGPEAPRAAPIEGVRALQDALRRCYQRDLSDADGFYGTATGLAVLYAQDLHGIDKDGVFGPQTSGAMRWPRYRDAGGEFESCVAVGPP
ncbi:serine/threonine-protein kinase [Nocardia sp. NPDC050713]|uniref:serine/threonine-protein kinase n=1 Tax=unclassified Nocardia TaxID=2637762 RepID=UPI0033A5E508